jgi:excisionase family DNA binding protein
LLREQIRVHKSRAEFWTHGRQIGLSPCGAYIGRRGLDPGAVMAATNATSDVVLISQSEAARRLGVSLRTLYSLRAAGKLPCVRIGRALRFRPTDLERFAAGCLVSEGRDAR